MHFTFAMHFDHGLLPPHACIPPFMLWQQTAALQVAII
jgi:hypothetical protein